MSSNSVRSTTGSELTALLEGNLPVLVKFYAPWCAPCRAMAPIFERLAGSFAGRAVFAQIDVDNDPDFAAQRGVRAVPTFILFSSGKAVGQIAGATSEKALTDLLGPAVEKSRDTLAPAV